MSNGTVLNIAAIARELGVDNKTVENYIRILEDMMLAIRLPVFSKRAKRRLLKHEKFYFFDCGIFKTLRPLGPLDSIDEITGISLEMLVLNELRALNDYLAVGYKIFFWRTPLGNEVDFVLYGKSGFIAIEVKKAATLNHSDYAGLKTFLKDYPEAKGYIFYGGDRKNFHDKITIIPATEALKNLRQIIAD